MTEYQCYATSMNGEHVSAINLSNYSNLTTIQMNIALKASTIW